MALSALPMGVFGIRPEWIPQSRQAIEAPELPMPDLKPMAAPDLSALQRPAPQPAQRPQGRGFGRSDDFYSGLLKGGAALLSGQGLGGWAGAMGDSLDLYRKRRIGTSEMVDPSKYVQAVTDPETGEISYKINEDLRKANQQDIEAKATIVKPMSEYQQDQSDRGWTGMGVKAGQYDRTQTERERANRARETLLAQGFEARVVDRMLSQGLAYGKEGADVPEGYEVPVPGVPQAEQAPRPSGTGARGDRNGNTGNIKDGPWARSQPGYQGSDGTFARFAPGAGEAAKQRLLGSYIKRGFDTPSKIINRWAPVGRENTPQQVANYTAYVARRAGIDPNQPVPADKLPLVAQAIAEFENGRTVGTGGQAPRTLSVPKVRVANRPATTAPSTFKVGQSINGHTFKGGDPKDRNNWS